MMGHGMMGGWGGRCECMDKDGQPDHDHVMCKGCLEHKKKHLEGKLAWVNEQLAKMDDKDK